MNVKTKIRLGLLFLLAIIILLAGAGSYYVNKLADESKDMLKDNYNTLQYTKNMIEALDGNDDEATVKMFEENLVSQENNITEKGEAEATKEMRSVFEIYKSGKRDGATESDLRKKILHVQDLNMQAIVHKNNVITTKTKTAFAYITMLGTLCCLLSLTFVINFPRWIAGPISTLTEGIRSISKKDYTTRIQIESKDEFGELATAFNKMATELDAWEHSNVSQLLFEKSRIEAIINNMQDAVIGLDEKRNILFINQVAEGLLMLDKKEIIGKYAPDVALKNDLFRNLLNKELTADLKIYANNKESYFTKNYREVISDEKIIGEVIALHNVTPFKELDSAKTNFIATVSHELKTPIAAIKMSLQLLQNTKSGALNTDQSQLLESIDDDTNRLLKITGELLNMAQVETGNIQLTFNQVTPKHIVELATEAVHTLAEQKQIQVETSLPDNLPYVNADLDKTVWVLVNLLTNAIRYSAEQSKIQIAVEASQNKIQFSIKDFGIGIDEKYLPRVFERYFKVPGSKGGTGLGLSISKEFIEAQGGSIWVQSQANTGSQFTFSLNAVA
jgi:NtrC-family two-component system sensor histidine kinase KinB